MRPAAVGQDSLALASCKIVQPQKDSPPPMRPNNKRKPNELKHPEKLNLITFISG
jgi:hypothetical protein